MNTPLLFAQPSRPTPSLAPTLPATRPRLPFLPRWVSAAPGPPGLEGDHPITPGRWLTALLGPWAWAKQRRPRGVSGVGPPTGLGRHTAFS